VYFQNFIRAKVLAWRSDDKEQAKKEGESNEKSGRKCPEC
jgi:hypothetical protein